MADVFDFYVYDDRSIQFAIAEPIMLEDKDVTQFRFRIPKVLNNINMTSWEWWFIFVNAKKTKYTTQLTLTDDEDDPDNFSVATYTVGYGFSGYVGSVSFSIEALNVSGEDIVNEWHTRTYNTHVIDTLQGTRAVIPEPEADAGTGLTAEEKSLILELFSKAAYAEDDASTAYDRLEALWTIITRLVSLNLSHVTSSNQSASVENGSRYVTNLTADTNYALNSVTVTMGGVDITSTAYSSGTVSIPSVTGNIVITATAVLAAQSITAVYTQSGTVYDTDSLDSLKADLVVTANYAGGTSETVPASDYTLSGTLTAGTSTITVSYAGLTTTFNVTVSTYITNGLIHYWDAINNTGNGHDLTATTWADLVGTNDFTINGSQIAWGTNYLSFPGVTGNYLFSLEDADHSGGKTVEVCFKPDNAQTTVVCCAFNNEGADTSASNAFGKIVIYSDNSVNAKGQSSTSYPTGLTALTDVNSVSASYSADTTISAVYVNGVAKTASGSSHSMRGSSKKVTAGASPTNWDYAFKGKIYDIRIYNRVLSASEVAENYQVDLARFGLE